jgi:hypothetical protein
LDTVQMPPHDRLLRATRYDITGTLLYRQAGDSDWREARTINVSSTGLLYRAPPPALNTFTPVELVLMLPGLGAPVTGCVRCAGRIARFATAADAVLMAATIDQYRFFGSPAEAKGEHPW